MERIGVHLYGEEKGSSLWRAEVPSAIEMGTFSISFYLQCKQIARRKRESAVTHFVFQHLNQELLWLNSFFNVRYLP